MLLTSVAACDVAGGSAPDLGDAYTVLASPAPSLVQRRLTVAVQYGGGCREHTFDLRSEGTDARAEVWLVHDAHGDTCEALVVDTLAMTVPASVAAAEQVILRTPSSREITL